MYLIIDIGSNTVRAVIFRIEDNSLVPFLNKKYPAGLANYIDEDGSMSEQGIDCLVEILNEIKIIIDAFSLDGVYPFATASLRNVNNRDQVLERVEQEIGIKIKVISGKKEAYYDYYASIRTLDSDIHQGILTDIGGGSTELVAYHDMHMVLTESIAVGSLNMFNKYAKKIVLNKSEREDVYKDVLSRFKKENYKKATENLKLDVNKLCAVGGSCRSALKLYNSIHKKSSSNLEFEVKFLDSIFKGNYSEQELALMILKSSPERIHTLVPGMMILKAVADYFKIKKIKVNTHGVREGYLYYQLEKEGVLNAEDIHPK